MTYNIRVREKMGDELSVPVAVECLKEFRLYGERFFAHHYYGWNGPTLAHFVVSHVETGLKVGVSNPLLAEAIKSAKKEVYGLGRKDLYRAVEITIRKFGRANP
jgi:hypothetical protein